MRLRHVASATGTLVIAVREGVSMARERVASDYDVIEDGAVRLAPY